MPTRPAWARAAVAAGTALALVWLAAGLPAGAFFSGDSGVKLMAARNALDHPSRPFQIDLPRIGQHTTTLVDQMVVVHGGHGHVLQSPLFPALSAPLIAAFGLRGAYVWPALAFIAMFPILDAIRRRTLPDTPSAVLAWTAVLASPLLLYALEFWEHVPAVALLAAGTLVIVAATETPAAGPAPPHQRWVAAAGGALAGAGVLLRPEGAWYALGLVVTVGRRQWLPIGCGTAAMLVPFAAVNLWHFGNPLGAHASAVLAPLGVDFVGARWQRLQDWIWPSSALAAGGLALVAAAWLPGPLLRNLRTRQVLALTGTAIVGVLAARRALPEQSFWQGFPAALLAFVPTGVTTAPIRRLYGLVLVGVAGVVLTATNDGGAQWGTRYLLIATPPLLLLAARGAAGAAAPGAWRPIRMAITAAVLLAAAFTSRESYLELRGAKRNYASLVAAAESFTMPGETILTNVWWLDQVAASLYGQRVFLYASDRPAVASAIALLAHEKIGRVTLADTAGDGEAPLEALLDGTCFRTTAVHDLPLRSLRFTSARCVAD